LIWRAIYRIIPSLATEYCLPVVDDTEVAVSMNFGAMDIECLSLGINVHSRVLVSQFLVQIIGGFTQKSHLLVHKCQETVERLLEPFHHLNFQNQLTMRFVMRQVNADTTLAAKPDLFQ